MKWPGLDLGHSSRLMMMRYLWVVRVHNELNWGGLCCEQNRRFGIVPFMIVYTPQAILSYVHDLGHTHSGLMTVKCRVVLFFFNKVCDLGHAGSLDWWRWPQFISGVLDHSVIIRRFLQGAVELLKHIRLCKTTISSLLSARNRG